MAETVVINCGLGTIERRTLTPDEEAQAAIDAADTAKHQQARQKTESDREGVLAAMSQKLGIPIDDLKVTLGVGRRETKPHPQKLKYLKQQREMKERMLAEEAEANAE